MRRLPLATDVALMRRLPLATDVALMRRLPLATAIALMRRLPLATAIALMRDDLGVIHVLLLLNLVYDAGFFDAGRARVFLATSCLLRVVVSVRRRRHLAPFSNSKNTTSP
jgi:hypothetical protein